MKKLFCTLIFSLTTLSFCMDQNEEMDEVVLLLENPLIDEATITLEKVAITANQVSLDVQKFAFGTTMAESEYIDQSLGDDCIIS